MNRRSFLQWAGAAVAGCLVAPGAVATPKPEGVTLEMLKKYVGSWPVYSPPMIDGNYVMLIRPEQAEELRKIYWSDMGDVSDFSCITEVSRGVKL